METVHNQTHLEPIGNFGGYVCTEAVTVVVGLLDCTVVAEVADGEQVVGSLIATRSLHVVLLNGCRLEGYIKPVGIGVDDWGILEESRIVQLLHLQTVQHM